MSSRKSTEKRKKEANQAPAIYKIAPKEMIVTRNKSAQMKQKPYHQGINFIKLSDLIGTTDMSAITNVKRKPSAKPRSPQKTPPKADKTSKSIPCPPKKRTGDQAVNKQEVDTSKLKRNQCTRKIMLKPKSALKTIGGLNKRKMTVPKHNESYETKRPKTDDENARAGGSVSSSLESMLHRQRNEKDPYYGLSITEIVKMKDETEELTDEDLMAILECPSPVWWEEHSEFSDDEAISATIQQPVAEESLSSNPDNVSTGSTKSAGATEDDPEAEKSDLSKILESRRLENDQAESVPDIFRTTFGEFTKKKSLLENVLAKIKTNSSNVTAADHKNVGKVDAPVERNNEVAADSPTSEKQSPKSNKSKLKPKKMKPIVIKKSRIESGAVFKDSLKGVALNMLHKKGNAKGKESVRVSKSLDCVGDNERALDILENIKIPVVGDSSSGDLMKAAIANIDPCTNTSFLKPTDNPEIVAQTLSNDASVDSSISSPLAVVWTDHITGDQKFINITNSVPVEETDKVKPHQEHEDSSDIPKELPPLRKYPKIEVPDVKVNVDSFLSPKPSMETSESDEVLECSSLISNKEEMDTISDTNIQFITDDEDANGKGAKTESLTVQDKGFIPKPDPENVSNPEPPNVNMDPVNSDTIKLEQATNNHNEKGMQFFLNNKTNNEGFIESCDTKDIGKDDFSNVNTDERIYLVTNPKTGKEQYLRVIQILDDNSKSAQQSTEPTDVDGSSAADSRLHENENVDNHTSEMLKDVITIKNLVNDRERTECHSTILKDKQNIEAACESQGKDDGNQDTRSKHVDSKSNSKRRLKETRNNQDARGGSCANHNEVIAEQYASILTKKYVDSASSKRKLKQTGNTAEHTEPDNGERDLTVYMDVINCQKYNNNTDTVVEIEISNSEKSLGDEPAISSECLAAKKNVKFCYQCSELYDTEACCYCSTSTDSNHNLKSTANDITLKSIVII